MLRLDPSGRRTLGEFFLPDARVRARGISRKRSHSLGRHQPMLSARLALLLRSTDLRALALRLGTGPTVISTVLRGVRVAPAIRAALEAHLPGVELESDVEGVCR